MKKIWKSLLATSLAIPFTISIGGCGKDDDSKMETWDGTIQEVSAAENGVITIDTAEELAGLAKKVNEGTTYNGYTIKLAADMDLDNKEWTPIGYGTSNYAGEIETGAFFDGLFDGQNHTIYNLKITSFDKGGIGATDAATGVAFIGHNRGEIKNLTIDTADVNGNHYVGVISGFNVDATITNCHVKNSKVNNVYDNIDDSGDKAGAIAGHFAKGILQESVASLTNCSVENTTIKADRDAGQVVGCLANGATQSNNTATNVEVSWNESGTTEGKSNTNITDDIVGRIA